MCPMLKLKKEEVEEMFYFFTCIFFFLFSIAVAVAVAVILSFYRSLETCIWKICNYKKSTHELIYLSLSLSLTILTNNSFYFILLLFNFLVWFGFFYIFFLVY